MHYTTAHAYIPVPFLMSRDHLRPAMPSPRSACLIWRVVRVGGSCLASGRAVPVFSATLSQSKYWS